MIFLLLTFFVVFTLTNYIDLFYNFENYSTIYNNNSRKEDIVLNRIAMIVTKTVEYDRQKTKDEKSNQIHII